MTLPEIGTELGIPQHRFEYWRDRAMVVVRPKPDAFVPVAVCDDPPDVVTLVSPSGFRIEGLTVEQAIAMLVAIR